MFCDVDVDDLNGDMVSKRTEGVRYVCVGRKGGGRDVQHPASGCVWCKGH